MNEEGLRVFRGGSFGYTPPNVRSAYRNAIDPAGRYDNLGFRLTQDMQPFSLCRGVMRGDRKPTKRYGIASGEGLRELNQRIDLSNDRFGSLADLPVLQLKSHPRVAFRCPLLARWFGPSCANDQKTGAPKRP